MSTHTAPVSAAPAHRGAGIYVALAPWLIFTVLAHVSVEAGALVALAAAVVIAIPSIAARRPKLIEIGAVIAFGTIAVAALGADADWLQRYARAIAAGGVAVLAFGSLLFTPFTEQYARELVPEESWSSPVFKAVNRRLTGLWASVFAAMVPCHIAAGAIDTQRANLVFNWLIPIALVYLAAKRTAAETDRMTTALPANSRWWILATMTGSLSMIMIDQTVVSVALPTMQRDLGLSTAGVQWVVNAYLLALAVLVALGGRVADLLGPERVFRWGAALFVTASALCGLAGGEAAIIAARALQGFGAAMMVPATSAIILNAFSPGERGKAMGIYSGVSMVFLALGPLVGGLLTQSVSWRAVFFINLPLGVAMLCAARFTLPRPALARIPGGAIDWLGIPLLIGALGTLTLALMQGQTWGWGSVVISGLFGISAVLWPVFVWHELRCPQPLIRLSLLALRNFKPDTAILGGVQFALVGASVFGAIWGQEVLGYSAIRAGESLLPLTLTLLLVAPAGGRMYDRVGPRALLTLGSLLVACGLGWLSMHLHLREYAWLVPGYVALGAGLGLVISPATTDALGAAAPSERSQASGLVQSVRQLGGVVGIAVLGAIVAAVSSVGADATPAERLTAATNGVAAAYGVGAAVMLVAALAAWTFVRRREPAPAPAAAAMATA